MEFIFIVFLIFVCLVQCSQSQYELLGSFNHDRKCFTQAYVFYGSKIIETCGLYGKSSIRMIDPDTGSVLKESKIDAHFFAEGATIIDGMLYVLTWKEKTVIVFDIDKWAVAQMIQNVFTTTGQGWGMTDDGKGTVYVSDGSDQILVYRIKKEKDKSDVALVYHQAEQLTVMHNGRRTRNINELEYVNGYIYANVWYKDHILKIDPRTAQVVESVDFSALYPPALRRSHHADCLNGIAYDKRSSTFFLTGKLWHKVYRVKIYNATPDEL